MILFGPPGSGKGTQAQQIARRLGVPHISTGHMIRVQVAAQTELGRRAQAIVEQGELIPDEWVNHMVEQRLLEPDCERGFVLDGYPRTRQQAEALVELLGRDGTRVRVFNLAVGYNEIIRRITGRRTCSHCGTIYNMHLQPPRQADRCDRDGMPLVIRSDDREEVIRERIEAYERQSRPVIDFFRESGQVIHEVDGSRSPEQVSGQLWERLAVA